MTNKEITEIIIEHAKSNARHDNLGSKTFYDLVYSAVKLADSNGRVAVAQEINNQ